jgi:hypothetical protein
LFEYYDKTYQYGIDSWSSDKIIIKHFENFNSVEIANELLKKLGVNKTTQILYLQSELKKIKDSNEPQVSIFETIANISNILGFSFYKPYETTVIMFY